LARLALCKQITQSIDKIKKDKKIMESGWKHTFIQYKSRWEKRKSWKEKTKMLRDIEKKLTDEGVDMSEDKSEKKKATPTEKETLKRKSDSSDKVITKNLVKKQKSNLLESDESSETEAEENNVELNGMDSDSDNESEYNSEDYDNFATENEAKAPKATLETLKKGQTEPENEEEENEQDWVDDDENSIDLSNVYVYSRENLEDNTEKLNKLSAEMEEKEKRLFFSNKPAHMEIKQLNLDEIKDLDEIPIDEKSQSDNELGGDDDESRFEKNRRFIKTVKVEEDPFFLDKEGCEIQGNDDLYGFNRRRYNNFNENNNYYDRSYYDDKRNFNSKKYELQSSSFKSSLSYERKPYGGSGGSDSYGNRDGYRGDYRRDQNSDRSFDRKRFGDQREKPYEKSRNNCNYF
jgi:hypothetical protein